MCENYNKLYNHEEKLKYVSKLLNLKTKNIAEKLGMKDSFISSKNNEESLQIVKFLTIVNEIIV